MTTSVEPASRSAADRLARRILNVEGAEPRALLPLRGSLVISAVRCLVTYALIPALTPLLGWLDVLGPSLSLALSSLAIVLAFNSLRRVWLADWSHRWPYTAFIVVVLVILAGVIAFDVDALL